MSRPSYLADHRVGVGLLALLVGTPLQVVFHTPRYAAAQSTETPEVTSHDSLPTFAFRVQHNEVMVRVIVRDSKGNPVTRLKQSDFRVFDDRKLQLITHFAEEWAVQEAARAPGVSTAARGSPPVGGAAPAPLAERFMALYFDDVHLQFGDLARTRDAGSLIATITALKVEDCLMPT